MSTEPATTSQGLSDTTQVSTPQDKYMMELQSLTDQVKAITKKLNKLEKVVICSIAHFSMPAIAEHQ
jgi:hypothetical protein